MHLRNHSIGGKDSRRLPEKRRTKRKTNSLMLNSQSQRMEAHLLVACQKMEAVTSLINRKTKKKRKSQRHPISSKALTPSRRSTRTVRPNTTRATRLLKVKTRIAATIRTKGKSTVAPSLTQPSRLSVSVPDQSTSRSKLEL